MIDIKQYYSDEHGTSKSVPPPFPAADARQKDSSQDSSPWLIPPVPLRS
jgi:hypothetical protein